jgi:hypothetical protein
MTTARACVLLRSAVTSCVVVVASLVGCARDGTAPSAPRPPEAATSSTSSTSPAASSPAPIASSPATAPATSSPAPIASSPAADASGLHVELHLASKRIARIADLSATITLRNDGNAPRRVYVRYMAAGNLSLEVVDASGARVPPMSPPVPTVDDGVTGWTTLAPGAARTFTCDASIAIDPPPGHYRVRFKGVPGDRDAGALRTDFIDFDIGP